MKICSGTKEIKVKVRPDRDSCMGSIQIYGEIITHGILCIMPLYLTWGVEENSGAHLSCDYLHVWSELTPHGYSHRW